MQYLVYDLGEIFTSHWQIPCSFKEITYRPHWSWCVIFVRFHVCGKCPKNPCVLGGGLLACTCSLVKCHSSVLDIRQQTGMCLGSHSKPILPVRIKDAPRPCCFVVTPEWREACVNMRAPKAESTQLFCSSATPCFMPTWKPRRPVPKRLHITSPCATGVKKLCSSVGDCCWEWMEGSVHTHKYL